MYVVGRRYSFFDQRDSYMNKYASASTGWVWKHVIPWNNIRNQLLANNNFYHSELDFNVAPRAKERLCKLKEVSYIDRLGIRQFRIESRFFSCSLDVASIFNVDIQHAQQLFTFFQGNKTILDLPIYYTKLKASFCCLFFLGIAKVYIMFT